MVELELLGANGDTIVMTDEDGERYSIVVDDALRAAVRRDRGAIVPPSTTTAETPAPLRPRQLQAYMRAGATAAEVAISTGMDVEHVHACADRHLGGGRAGAPAPPAAPGLHARRRDRC